MGHDIENNTKLTEKEFEEFLSNVEEINPKEDHSRAYRTLSNPIRREILNVLELNILQTEDFLEKMDADLTDDQLKYHLSMLEQLNYIMNTDKGWKITPRGLGFLEHAQLDE
ncbi:MAG: hypothetical protein ACOC44_03365 [Promethearchaeia archaeon]